MTHHSPKNQFSSKQRSIRTISSSANFRVFRNPYHHPAALVLGRVVCRKAVFCKSPESARHPSRPRRIVRRRDWLPRFGCGQRSRSAWASWRRRLARAAIFSFARRSSPTLPSWKECSSNRQDVSGEGRPRKRQAPLSVTRQVAFWQHHSTTNNPLKKPLCPTGGLSVSRCFG